MRHQFDYLVLGSGIAGLSFALQASRHGTVAMLAKRGRSETNTVYAQGGIAAVLAPQDSVEEHIPDTLAAGGGLCREGALPATGREGPPPGAPPLPPPPPFPPPPPPPPSPLP